ncbi:hypothetical protein PC9H_002785 [Pleurotus ostreatus]|uniref:Uncharacterized protein n=1 Tax=Pleurotus ostreatus TaxID=5322 RepID=A0A8H6ZJ98_PLEOS|nr:uncharacterized protein PC9H_002785 [Pleurotus ostreatus]KAF7416041.1 hypothetical protein PC9H_002785 [Pleurotus ostreatus]
MRTFGDKGCHAGFIKFNGGAGEVWDDSRTDGVNAEMHYGSRLRLDTYCRHEPFWVAFLRCPSRLQR